MRRLWSIFSQAVTVAVAVLFVVLTLRPHWLQGAWPWRAAPAQVVVAPPTPVAAASAAGAGSAPGAVAMSLAPAARVAMPAVVRIVASRGAGSGATSSAGPASGSARPAPRDPADPDAQEPDAENGVSESPGVDRPTLPPSHPPVPGLSRAPDRPRAGIGSAVIVSRDGYLLTNRHVVVQSDSIDVQLADGRSAPARLVGMDPETDLAVLQIALQPLPVIALGSSTTLQVGDALLAIGYPYAVGQTVTSGIVSALGRSQLGLSAFEDFIQTDAAINRGNSGGALVDVRGALVGINTAIYSESGGSQGIGFAIPVDMAREVLDAIVRDGRVVRGWIGVELRELTPELAQTLGVAPNRGGALVAGVLQDGPAHAAGMEPGDVVLQVGDSQIGGAGALQRTVSRLKPGQTVALSLLRRGQAREVSVTVSQRPQR